MPLMDRGKIDIDEMEEHSLIKREDEDDIRHEKIKYIK